VTFLNCSKVLLWGEGRFKSIRELHWKMFIASVLMFIFATLDVMTHVERNLDAFVRSDDDPIVTFQDMTDWTSVLSMACFVAQTFVGDCILVGWNSLDVSPRLTINPLSFTDAGSSTTRVTSPSCHRWFFGLHAQVSASC